jgi:hypothetical protein
LVFESDHQEISICKYGGRRMSYEEDEARMPNVVETLWRIADALELMLELAQNKLEEEE